MPISIEQLQQTVRDAKSYCDVLRILGLNRTGSAMHNIKRRIERNKLDTTHFKWSRSKASSNKIPWQKLLINNPSLRDRRPGKMLTRALIESGREYKCQCCGRKKWLKQKIKLEVHHVDGDWKNNQSDNLEFLCPNCHTMTENFFNKKIKHYCECGKSRSRLSRQCKECGRKTAGLSIRKVNRPDKETLTKLIWEKPTVLIAADYKVSDKAVEKWCKSYNIAKPPRGYWQKQQSISVPAARLYDTQKDNWFDSSMDYLTNAE